MNNLHCFTIKADTGDKVVFQFQPIQQDAGIDWVSARVKIAAGCFNGDYEACFEAQDFHRLAGQLDAMHESLTGEAHFRTIEDQLRLDFRIDQLGHIALDGVASDQAGGDNELRFSLSLDQSYLPQIISNLRVVGSYQG